MRIPEGWEYVSDYCIRRGEYTICRIGGANGFTYELWRKKKQLHVNLASSQEALSLWASLTGSNPIAA
jgi:hypothetical protein